MNRVLSLRNADVWMDGWVDGWGYETLPSIILIYSIASNSIPSHPIITKRAIISYTIEQSTTTTTTTTTTTIICTNPLTSPSPHPHPLSSAGDYVLSSPAPASYALPPPSLPPTHTLNNTTYPPPPPPPLTINICLSTTRTTTNRYQH